MKKLIAAILIISCILSFSVCNADSTYWRFSTFGDSDQTNGIFDGDYFAFDLYMSPATLTAFVQLTTWKEYDVTTTTKFAKVKTRTNNPGVLYFVFSDGSYYTGKYDEKGTYILWLDIKGYSIMLESVDEFIPLLHMKEV